MNDVNNKSIVDRVTDYIAGSKDIELRGMAELSPRAVAVMDNFNETDVYFDAESYRLIMEQLWKDGEGNNSLIPPVLEGSGLGVLSGVSRVPQIKDYDAALRFAKQQLEPIIEKDQFYEKPVELK